MDEGQATDASASNKSVGSLLPARLANASANLDQAAADSTANNHGSQQQGTCAKSVQQQYDRIRVLGKGSFGAAIVHRRRADCSLVVLKEIDLSRFRGERERRSALQEAQIMSTLNHINIIKYHNAYTTETKLIIEMEYASIGTLAHFLTFQVNPLEEQEILIIFRQITSGLNYLHSKNIIHLDLKMANIFITIEGLVKIGDFGIAQYITTTTSAPATAAKAGDCYGEGAGDFDDEGRRRNLASKTKQTATSNSNNNNSQLGTLAYSSPERCLGEQTDFKSDIWSLGCILYELICAKPLFSGDSLPELVLNITRIHYNPIKRNDISAGLRESFEQMIAREPEQRPSAKDLLCVSGQLLSRIQLQRHKVLSKRQSNNNHHRFDLSTEVAMVAANNNNNQEDQLAHISYPHSLVYQVRLDSRHIHVDRVNLPQTKRIKEISKGRSHYLVLTYDNIVYGWGTKSSGQLGACGLTSSSSSSNQSVSSGGGFSSNSRPKVSHSAANSISTRDFQFLQMNLPWPGSSLRTLASSSAQNISAPSQSPKQQQQPVMSKQLVMSMLRETQPTSRPFIINELNHRKIIQVAAGNDFSVFLSKTGIVMTCGDGSTGCLGRGDQTSCFTPCMVESLLNTDVVCIACGPEHVVAVCGNGRAFAWGKNRNGRLGIQAPRRSLSSFASSQSSIARHQQQQQQQSHCLPASKFTARPQPVQLPSAVIVKSVYCGDKSTVFIDSENRCWACGENSFNKLGLDVQRRFKKTLIVDCCATPTEISSLGKHKIVSCNIGKRHSTFITSEGKLIVFGQDIDHAYRLQSNIMCARDSHRRISFELQTSKRRKDGRLGIRQASSVLAANTLAADQAWSVSNLKPGWPDTRNSSKNSSSSNQLTMCRAPSYKRLMQSTLANNQLDNFKQSIASCEASGDSGTTMMTQKRRTPAEYPRYKLSRLHRQQIDSYVRKSRSTKKVPFECVIGASCTPKFTLALTNDNRVYFWGTRSHKKEGFEGSNPLLAPQPSPRANLVPNRAGHSARRRGRRSCCSCVDCSKREEQRQLAKMIAASKSVEPQLVAGCSDECFVKIGATNNSLMSNIQVLGSDQPIIHAQDPRLIAQSLADLWILDYQPTRSSSSSSDSSSACCCCSNSSSRSSSCSPSPPGSPSTSHKSTLASSCSSCSACSCEQYSGREYAKSLGADSASNLDLQSHADRLMGHDAILKPQPIVSLYVPSMYNHHSGCSLNLVDLFCFDEDRFYLILDTTLKLQQYQHHSSRPASANALSPPANTQHRQATTRLRLGSVNEAIVGSHLRSAARQQQLNEVAANSSKLSTAARAEPAATNPAEQQQQQQQQQLLSASSANSRPKNSSSMRLSNRPADGATSAETSHLRPHVVSDLPGGNAERGVELGLDANQTVGASAALSAVAVAVAAAAAAAANQQAAASTCHLQTNATVATEIAASCEDDCNDNNNNNNSSSSSNDDARSPNNNLVGDGCSDNASNQTPNQSDNSVTPLVCSSSQGGGVSLEEPRSLSTFVAAISGNHHTLVVDGPTMRTLNADQTLRPLNFEPRRVSSRGVGDGEELVDDASSDAIFEDSGDQLGGIPVVAFGAPGVASSGKQHRDQHGRRRNRRQLNKSESTTFTGNIDIDETSSMPSWVRNEFIQQQQQQQQQQHPLGSEAGLFVVDCSSATEDDTFMSGVSAATEMTLDGNNDDGGGDNEKEENESTATPTNGHAAPPQPAVNNSRASLFSASSTTSSPRCSIQSSRQQLSALDAAEGSSAQQPDVFAGEAKDGALNNATSGRGQDGLDWPCSKPAQFELGGKTRGLQMSRSQPDSMSSGGKDTGNDTCAIGESKLRQPIDSCSLARRALSIVDNSAGAEKLLLLVELEKQQQTAGTSNLLDCQVYRASSGAYRRDSGEPANLSQHYRSSTFNSAFSSLANSRHLLISGDNVDADTNSPEQLQEEEEQQKLSHSRGPKKRRAPANGAAVAAACSVPAINQSSPFEAVRRDCLPGGDQAEDVICRQDGRGQATSMSQPALNQAAPFVVRRDSSSGSSRSAASSSSTCEIAADAQQVAATRAKTSSCSSLASLRRSLMKLFC